MTLNVMLLVNSRQRSCWKVIFSVVSVRHSGGGSHVTIIHDALEVTVQDPQPQLHHAPPPDIRHGTPPRDQVWNPLCPPLVTHSGHHWRPVQTVHLRTCSFTLVLRSGGHRSTYGLQAGGTHPTAMLSCYIKFLL